MIVAQNSLLNQYVPAFYIRDIIDGQILKFDSTRRGFVNVTPTDSGGSGGVDKLGELLNVSPTVDSPNPTLHTGQALVYNSLTTLWENTYVDYNTLLNKPVIPTNNSFSFSGLSDTATPSLPDSYVKWNSAGTQLVYSSTIPVASITGLATVAISGNYNDLLNKPSGLGSVTNVSVVASNGVSGTVANPTTTPSITISLGAITPTSVAATGTVTGLNLSGTHTGTSSGTNTGDQTITLTGDVTGSGTGSFVTSYTGIVPITKGGTGQSTAINAINALLPSQIGNTGKYLSTNGSTASWVTGDGTGTVTSVGISGANGIGVTNTPITSTGVIALTLGAITPTSVAATGTVTGSNLSGSSSGTNTGDQTITLTGDVTGSGTGSFVTSLSTTGVVANTYGSSTQVPVFTVNSKGRITGVTNTTIMTAGSGTVTSVSGFGNQGVAVTVLNGTTTPAITIGLGAITPTSVAATGTVTGSNLSGTHTGTSSGTNTGDQTITLTGDVTGAGTGSFVTSLSVTGVAAATYTNPILTVDIHGRITSASNGTIGIGTVTSVTGTGTVSGITLSGNVTTSGNLTLGGALSLTSGQVTTALGFTPYNSTNPAGYTSNTGTVTSVGISGANGIGVTNTPITDTGVIALTLGAITPTSVAATGTVTGSNLSGTNTGNQTITLTGDVTGSGTGSFVTSLSATGVAAGTYNSASITVDIHGRITAASNGAGAGTVTSVSVTSTTDIVGTVATPATTPAMSLSLTTTGVSFGTYGSSSQVPVFTVDSKGRISNVTNTPIAGSGAGSAETVVFRYSSGGSGNFTPIDAIYSQTSGVTATITDGANCVATYTFTGKTTPPKSITIYGQNYSANTFSITGAPATGAPAPNSKVAGGGTSASPDLANGLFSSSNVLTFQTRMSDTGASAGIGQRAWLVVVFGF